ncbi:MAG: 8-oxo-dGTP diphosphatase [bacterium]|nr:8-oxo-dGTP diphosphatase [bacterium]
MKKELTLCIPLKDNAILLGMKKRGFGAGRWNGFGGKIEEGETIEQGALRELKEEVGIQSGVLEKKGVLEFSFQEKEKILRVHVFTLRNFKEDPIETEEMRPQWFLFDEIPFSQMWSADTYWIPLLLKGSFFKGAILFDMPSTAEYSAKILEQKIEEVLVLR